MKHDIVENLKDVIRKSANYISDEDRSAVIETVKNIDNSNVEELDGLEIVNFHTYADGPCHIGAFSDIGRVGIEVSSLNQYAVFVNYPQWAFELSIKSDGSGIKFFAGRDFVVVNYDGQALTAQIYTNIAKGEFEQMRDSIARGEPGFIDGITKKILLAGSKHYGEEVEKAAPTLKPDYIGRAEAGTFSAPEDVTLMPNFLKSFGLKALKDYKNRASAEKFEEYTKLRQ